MLLLLSLAVLYGTARAGQIPFQALSGDTRTSALNSASVWENLNTRPDNSSTGHLIFDTVNSLLQHWPNTRYRNGHNIIPGTVPVGTLLYHGREDGNLPTIPEWTATDPEHSFPFCGAPPLSMAPGNDSFSGCWQLTLVATRPLKVLYFDGSSAANIKDEGTMDAQDLLIWGHIDPARWVEDRARINDLCTWGREFGLDGYMRMEMDFEIMLCDFSQGVELLSADFLAAWWSDHITPALWRPNAYSTLEYPPPPSSALLSPHERSPWALDMLRFETVRGGAWHNHYPGDTRIVLDLTRFISFYDTALVPSLIARRDLSGRFGGSNTRLQEVLAPGVNTAGSGVDWQTLYRVVLDRYADRLELLEYLLNTTTAANLEDRAGTIQRQLRTMLNPYILFSARPKSPVTAERLSSSVDDVWARPVWRGCATKHTAHIHKSIELQARLTVSERLLLNALDETSHEICRVIVRMWVAGVHVGLDPLISVQKKPVTSNIAHIIETWKVDSHALMAWLDWGVWVKCRPACGVEEMCYLPTWPFFWDRINDPERKDERWKRPQPRCIRQSEPYSRL
ncbi:hypothetical protein B0H13DRAFT_1968379 [Mycena leptocephala]|nr:hypothetical protein B0H13DRAFT_1968379 [Mycena leptocephala]